MPFWIRPKCALSSKPAPTYGSLALSVLAWISTVRSHESRLTAPTAAKHIEGPHNKTLAAPKNRAATSSVTRNHTSTPKQPVSPPSPIANLTSTDLYRCQRHQDTPPVNAAAPASTDPPRPTLTPINRITPPPSNVKTFGNRLFGDVINSSVPPARPATHATPTRIRGTLMESRQSASHRLSRCRHTSELLHLRERLMQQHLQTTDHSTACLGHRRGQWRGPRIIDSI